MEKKDSYYFQHDYYARNDPKLVNLMARHGVEGVGIFWCIVENLYEQGGRLDISSCNSIAFSLHVDNAIVESIVKDFDLFKDDGQVFWSESVNKRIEKQESIRSKRKAAVLKRWQKVRDESDDVITEPADDIQMYSTSTAEELQEDVEQINFAGLVKFWNDGVKKYGSIMGTLQDLKNKTRRGMVKARIRENSKQVFANTLVKGLQSDFLNGKNSKGFVGSFDWIIRPNNFVKVRDGNYDNKQTSIDNGTINQDNNAESRLAGAAGLVGRLLDEN